MRTYEFLDATQVVGLDNNARCRIKYAGNAKQRKACMTLQTVGSSNAGIQRNGLLA